MLPDLVQEMWLSFVELIRCISGVYCRRQGFLWVGFQHFRKLCGLSAGLDLHNQLSGTC